MEVREVIGSRCRYMSRESSVVTSKMTRTEAIRADFDLLAAHSTDAWDHNSHYYSFLLAQLPRRCARALEIGCGTGAFGDCWLAAPITCWRSTSPRK